MSVREKGSVYEQPSVYNQGGGGADPYLSKTPSRVFLSNGYITCVYEYDKISSEPLPGQGVSYDNKIGVMPIIDDIKFSDISDSLEINLVIHVPNAGSWSAMLVRNDNFRSPSNIRLYALVLEKSSSKISFVMRLNGSNTILFTNTGYVIPDLIKANITFYKSGGNWKAKVTLNNVLKCDSVIDVTGLDNEGLAPTFGYSKSDTSFGLPNTSYVYCGTYIKKDGVLIWGNEV